MRNIYGPKKIHKEIGQRVYTFMLSPFKFLILNAYTGAGKTTTALKVLEDNQMNWIYMPPYHINIDENLKLSQVRKFDYIHLQSRRILCELDYYRKIAEQGINIRPICEYSCPLKETTCPYYERKRELYKNPKSWAGVHHHITTFLPEFFEIWSKKQKIHRYYDVLVIDENPISVFYDSEEANPKSISRLIETMKKIEFEHPQLKDVIDFLNYLIAEYFSLENLDYEIVLHYFEKINFADFYNIYQETLIEAIRRGKVNAKEAPRDYLSIFAEIERKINEKNARFMIYKLFEREYNKKAYHFTVFRDSPLINCPLKIIGLDGTANINIWKSLVGRTPQVLDRRYRYQNLFMLDSHGNARYPFTSWVRHGKMTSTGKRLCNIIDDVCKSKEYNVLIASTIPLRRFIDKEIKSKNVKYCHFYYLRSRNDFYETADTLLVSCEPNVPPFKLRCFAELSGWDKSVWRQVFTQEEVVQSVGRIREELDYAPNMRKREKRETFILPYMKYPDGRLLFPEARLISEAHLREYLKTGVLPKDNREYKNEILDLCDNIDYITRKEISDILGVYYAKTRGLIDELLSEGELIDGGRKGVKRYQEVS